MRSKEWLWGREEQWISIRQYLGGKRVGEFNKVERRDELVSYVEMIRKELGSQAKKEF